MRPTDYGTNNTAYESDSDEVSLKSNSRNDVAVSCDNPFAKKVPFEEEKFAFDFAFFRRFYKINGILFRRLWSIPTGLFVFLVGMVVLKEYVVNRVGKIPSGYYITLGDKDLPGFWKQTSKSVGLIVAISVINCSIEYIQKVLSVMYRKILTKQCHRVYFDDIRYYQMNVLDKSIDNPDQRMTQDIYKFCSTYCSVLPKLLVSPFTIAYYVREGVILSGWQSPIGCFGFFLFSTIVNKFFMGPIIHYVAKQERREGDFRFLHMLVRVNSESLAFHDAASTEQGKIDASLKKLVRTQHSLYIRQYFLDFFVNLVDYFGSIFSYLMLAIPIFSGKHDDLSPSELSALISENAFVLIYLIFSFTSVIDLAKQFADIAGVTHRIAQFLERISALKEYWQNFNPDSDAQSDCKDLDEWMDKKKQIRRRIIVETTSQSSDVDDTTLPGKTLLIWKLKNANLTPPLKEQPLISKLSLKFKIGESVIITGASNAGKSSLLRVLKGMWPCTEGTLQRFYPQGPSWVYICPQKTYLTWGTIREQISFPLPPDKNQLDDKLILHYMDKLKLTHIVERIGGLDVPCSWSVFDNLSPGEMQRLCILRIFYHQPVVAVLDEVTSSLPTDTEEYIYAELKRFGITLVSVGHRETIRKFHDKNLRVGSDGKWAVYRIQQG